MADLIKIHAGCGPHIFPGWCNIDREPGPGGVIFNLPNDLVLWGTSSVDFIFTEHFIEHLTLRDGQKFLSECYRILKPGAVLRISTPDLQAVVHDYINEKIDRFAPTWTPKTPAQFLNEGMRSWGHEFLYDFDEIYLQLLGTGFQSRDISGCRWHQSDHAALRDLEIRPDHNDLIVEARK